MHSKFCRQAAFDLSASWILWFGDRCLGKDIRKEVFENHEMKGKPYGF